MSTLRRVASPKKSTTLEERATLARQEWWASAMSRASSSLVDSAFRFAVAEVSLEGLPVRNPEDMRKRAERLLLEMRSLGVMVRSADEIRYFTTNAKRELELARVLAGKYPVDPDPIEARPPTQEAAAEAMGSLVARLLTQPGLDALSRLATTLSTIGGSAPFKADVLALEAIDPHAQTITLSISDAAEFQRLSAALQQAQPEWQTWVALDEGLEP